MVYNGEMHKREIISIKDSEHIAAAGLVAVGVSIFFGFAVVKQLPYVSITDIFFYQAFHLSNTSSSLFSIMVFMSNLASFWPVFIITVLVGIALVFKKRTREALAWILAIGTAWVFSETLKYFFLVERPANGLMKAIGPAYPSGHATVVATIAVLATLLVIPLLKKPRMQMLTTGVTAVIALLVFASRLSLGVHWLSDVVGGLFLGTGIALSAFGILKLMHRSV